MRAPAVLFFLRVFSSSMPGEKEAPPAVRASLLGEPAQESGWPTVPQR